jgi:ectoine hydroxylase-related dioxygenase (phytanoyl-CoA dioxygenase family)
VLYTSLFYERGSAQEVHRDTPVFVTRPEYRYFGTWVALEDTDPDNGPLVVVRGGHLLPEIDREGIARSFCANLDDVPALSNDMWVSYQHEVAAQCARAGLGTDPVCAKMGDTIIWHPQAPHGGAPIRDLRRTRFSLVMHSTPLGVPVYRQDVFFNPSKPVSDRAPWNYVSRGRRRYADFREISFGHVRSYPLEAFQNTEQTAMDRVAGRGT